MIWPTSALSTVVTKVDSSGPDPENERFTYLDLSAIDSNRKVIVHAKDLAINEAPSRARHRTAPGDVLVSTVRPNLNGVALVGDAYDGAIASTGFCVLRPRSGELSAQFLFQWTKTPDFIARMTRLATGASYPAVSDAIVKASTIPLPPFHEQKRLAAILDRADEMRNRRREALTLLEELADSYLDLALQRADRLTCKSRTLGEHLSFLTSGSRGWAKYYSETGTPFLRIQNVGRDQYIARDLARVEAPEGAEERRTRVQTGDVVLSITADLGRTAVIPTALGGAHVNQHLAILRTHSLNPRFLSAYLSSARGKAALMKRNKAAVKDGLNFDDIRSVEIPDVQPDDQRELSVTLDSIDHVRQATFRSMDELDQLVASLQHRAFRGEL